jgi:hypothetical protein
VKRSSRHVKAFTGTAVLLGAAVALAGCSATNPATIAKPYTAADGTNADISDPATGATVKLRNFLVVGSAKGKPAVLIGAIANEGTTPVDVTFTVLSAGSQTPLATGNVTAKPGVLSFVGPGGTAVQLPDLPGAPGIVLTLRADTAAGGQQMFVPVVDNAEGTPYASITPDPNAPAPAQPSASPSAS